MPRFISDDIKKNICDFYCSQPVSYSEVKEKFNVSLPVIAKILKENKIKIYSKQELYNYGTNERIFETIDTEEKAYFLGLLLTDGCIYEYKYSSMGISLMLQERDAYMVERFASFIKTNRKIIIDKRDNSATAIIMSNLMAKDLMKYGVVPHKKNNRFLPELDNDLMPHLIRGMFDGDGSVYKRQGKRSPRLVTVYAGSKQITAMFKKYLVEKLNLADNFIYKDKIKDTYTISWSALADIEKLYYFMYDSAHVYLVRKKTCFEDFLRETSKYI